MRLVLGAGSAASGAAEDFCPFEGGRLELPGVLGGRPSLASRSATRAKRAAICSACAKTRRISVSLSSSSSDSQFIHSLNQPPKDLSKPPRAAKITANHGRQAQIMGDQSRVMFISLFFG